MEMTKERLEAYRNNKTEILSLKYILDNRWQSETMIGNDVILDYSKGYPIPQSIVGFDQEKYERLQERDLKRKERLEKECEEVEKFVEDIEDTQLHSIFRMYYLSGKSDAGSGADAYGEKHNQQENRQVSATFTQITSITVIMIIEPKAEFLRLVFPYIKPKRHLHRDVWVFFCCIMSRFGILWK